MTRIVVAALLALFAALPLAGEASALTVVPPGNRNKVQPKIVGDAVARTKETNSSFDEKYRKVYDLLKNDRELIAKIRSTARAYDIDPVHMLGAIVGEHTYNVDVYDRLQTYYVKALAYATNKFRFTYGDETIEQFLTRQEFAKCAEFKGDSYALWSCREDLWDTVFRGKTVGGKAFPYDRFAKVFFQPFYAGQTFGLGQESPLMALALSDMVAARSGYPKLNENRAAEVYDAIMNPDKSLAYMAASIRRSIDDYRAIARMDISGNPGITATLYNIGRAPQRARELARKGGLPEENYFGWFVNSKLADLRTLAGEAPPKEESGKATAPGRPDAPNKASTLAKPGTEALAKDGPPAGEDNVP